MNSGFFDWAARIAASAAELDARLSVRELALCMARKDLGVVAADEIVARARDYEAYMMENVTK